MVFSHRVRTLSPSATFEMARKSAELIAKGVEVVNLSVGEPDLETQAVLRWKKLTQKSTKMFDEGFITPSGRNYLSKATREAVIREYFLEGASKNSLAKKYSSSFPAI